jgi:hypothetical protein
MKIQTRHNITSFIWFGMGIYFTVASVIGLILSKNFDVAYGYRRDAIASLVISFAYGVASIVACLGLKRGKPWSVGMIMALSAASILYATTFFANNTLSSSGATFVVLLFLAGAFSIVAVWNKGNFAQHRLVRMNRTPSEPLGEQMTKNQKYTFIILAMVAFIGPFLVYSSLGESGIGAFLWLPLAILFVWSCIIIRDKPYLAISGLTVILVTVSLFLAIQLPNYWAYKERQKKLPTSQPLMTQPPSAKAGISKKPLSLELSVKGYGYQWHLNVDQNGEAQVVEVLPTPNTLKFKVNAGQLAELQQALVSEHFIELGNEYGDNVPDGGSCRMTITQGNRSKTVTVLFMQNWEQEGNNKLEEARRAVRILNIITKWKS